MRRLYLALCAGAVLFAASSGAEAAFTVVRWNFTGMCQIFDSNLPLPKFPPDHRRVSGIYATYGQADRARIGLIRRGVCW
jgi:hypothetical protein